MNLATQMRRMVSQGRAAIAAIRDDKLRMAYFHDAGQGRCTMSQEGMTYLYKLLQDTIKQNPKWERILCSAAHAAFFLVYPYPVHEGTVVLKYYGAMKKESLAYRADITATARLRFPVLLVYRMSSKSSSSEILCVDTGCDEIEFQRKAVSYYNRVWARQDNYEPFVSVLDGGDFAYQWDAAINKKQLG